MIFDTKTGMLVINKKETYYYALYVNPIASYANQYFGLSSN